MERIPVLFENDYCMVLRKPAGLAVQGGEGIGASLDSILAESYTPRPLLVHRLDRDTSGLILAAKGRDAAAAFSALFAGRSIRKLYLAAAKGVPASPSGIIRLDLDIKGSAKKSETSWSVIGSAKDASFSLLELELGTGRMHQIRRHLNLIGHPVLGDDKYGDFPLNKGLRKSHGLKRLLLHAARLVVPPLPGFLPEGLDIKDPLPEYFGPFVCQLDTNPV